MKESRREVREPKTAAKHAKKGQRWGKERHECPEGGPRQPEGGSGRQGGKTSGGVAILRLGLENSGFTEGISHLALYSVRAAPVNK